MSEMDKFPDWKSLSGITLEGGYELKEIVEAERERAVVRVRVLGDYSLRALASFYALSPAATQKQVELWETIRTFQRKSELSVPLGVGTLILDGLTVAYLVSQTPDESLATVVEARALQPEESSAVLRASAKGLQELHANGLIHGTVSPEEVQAIGEAIKLSTESVREVNTEPIVEPRSAKYVAPESSSRNLSIASDVWCLGATLFETLTQKTYEPGLYGEAEELKHPFGAVAARCLDPDPDKRGRLEELEAILRSKPPLPKAKPIAMMPPENKVAAMPAVPVVVPAQPFERKSSDIGATPPKSEAKVEREPGAKFPNEPPPGRKLPNELGYVPTNFKNEAKRPVVEEEGSGIPVRRGWIYAISAFVIIFLALWLLRGHSNAKRVAVLTPAEKSIPSNTTGGSQPKAAWPTKTLDPETKTGEPAARVAAAPRSQPAVTGEKTIWRVVLYTYSRQEDAVKKVADLNAKHPDLQIQVFSASANGGPYLAVAGGRMDRTQASHLRLTAIRDGMPHDAYIQNFNR